MTQKKSGLQKGKLEATENTVTNQVAELNAGGDLAITAKTGDVALEAPSSPAPAAPRSRRKRAWSACSRSPTAIAIGKQERQQPRLAVDDGQGPQRYHGEDGHYRRRKRPDGDGGQRRGGRYKDGKAPLNETITRLSEEPGLAWLKDMQSRNDVAWNAVAEAHDSWDYKSQGLSGPASAVIAIAIMVATQQ